MKILSKKLRKSRKNLVITLENLWKILENSFSANPCKHGKNFRKILEKTSENLGKTLRKLRKTLGTTWEILGKLRDIFFNWKQLVKFGENIGKFKFETGNIWNDLIFFTFQRF
jgi:hypothetical protein